MKLQRTLIPPRPPKFAALSMYIERLQIGIAANRPSHRINNLAVVVVCKPGSEGFANLRGTRPPGCPAVQSDALRTAGRHDRTTRPALAYAARSSGSRTADSISRTPPRRKPDCPVAVTTAGCDCFPIRSRVPPGTRWVAVIDLRLRVTAARARELALAIR